MIKGRLNSEPNIIREEMKGDLGNSWLIYNKSARQK